MLLLALVLLAGRVTVLDAPFPDLAVTLDGQTRHHRVGRHADLERELRVRATVADFRDDLHDGVVVDDVHVDPVVDGPDGAGFDGI